MIIIRKKENESVDRLLRRYKKKHRDVQIVREVRRRKEYVKPSDRRRKELAKAIYNNRKRLDLEG